MLHPEREIAMNKRCLLRHELAREAFFAFYSITPPQDSGIGVSVDRKAVYHHAVAHVLLSIAIDTDKFVGKEFQFLFTVSGFSMPC